MSLLREHHEKCSEQRFVEKKQKHHKYLYFWNYGTLLCSWLLACRCSILVIPVFSIQAVIKWFASRWLEIWRKERKKDKRTYLMLQLLGNLEMVQTNYKLHLKISLFFKKNFQSIRFYFWLIGSSLLFVTSSNKSSCNLNLQVTNFC